MAKFQPGDLIRRDEDGRVSLVLEILEVFGGRLHDYRLMMIKGGEGESMPMKAIYSGSTTYVEKVYDKLV